MGYKERKLKAIAEGMCLIPILLGCILGLLGGVIWLVYYCFIDGHGAWDLKDYLQCFLGLPLAIISWCGMAILCYGTIKELIVDILDVL